MPNYSDRMTVSCPTPWVNQWSINSLVTIEKQSSIKDDTKTFRPDQVDDPTLRATVPVAAQRLVRWSSATPNEIFWKGFIAAKYVVGDKFDDVPLEAWNLRAHVGWDPESVFVSTTRPYRDPSTDALKVWSRTLSSPNEHRFEYEIFAYGGIDINAAIGVEHKCADQHEFAFVGGIRAECIRSAREYMGTKIVRIWENTNFDHTINKVYTPAYSQLPAVRHTPNGAPIQAYPPSGATAPARDDPPRRASLDTDALMRGDGAGVVDALYDVKPVPRISFTCVPHHKTTGRSFFFCGNLYAHIVVDVINGKMKNTLSWGPRYSYKNWASLNNASFSGNVDAVLQNPDNRTQEMYFFSGDQYILANITGDDYIIEGPKKIVDGWPTLRKAGFKTVNAVLEKPVTDKEVWFFSGEKYALVDATPGSNKILKGPLVISNNWPSLKKAGFRTVDAILPHPYQGDEAFVFSGDQYAHIQIGPTDDTLVDGPKPISTEWPSLHEAKFV